MTGRDVLHKLVDALPEHDVPAVSALKELRNLDGPIREPNRHCPGTLCAIRRE